jgi:hypothetical protein
MERWKDEPVATHLTGQNARAVFHFGKSRQAQSKLRTAMASLQTILTEWSLIANVRTEGTKSN